MLKKSMIYSIALALVLSFQAEAQIVLIAPANGEQNVSLKPVFKWTGTQDEVHIQVFQQGQIILDQVAIGTEYALTPIQTLKPGIVYAWKIIAKDGQESQIFVFMTTAQVGAPQPDQIQGLTLLSPANGEQNVSLQPSFKWSGVQEEVRLQVLQSGQMIIDQVVKGSEFQISQEQRLKTGSIYAWKLITRSGQESPIFSFMTTKQQQGQTQGMVLLSPANGEQNVDLKPVFKWSGVQGQVRFQLLQENQVLIDQIVTGNENTFSPNQSLKPGITYSWKLIIRDGQESQVFLFNTSEDKKKTTAPTTKTAVGGSGVYTLSVTASGSGTVTINPKKDSYTKDEIVQLTATPDSESTFKNWTGDVFGGSYSVNLFLIIMDRHKTITANFEPVLFTLRVTAAGQGTVTVTPKKDSYTKDEKVDLQATPASGSTFRYWTGDVPGKGSTTNRLTITMDGNKNITANFAGTGPFNLSVTAAGTGTVTINPKKDSYTKDEKVDLQATPASGSTFRNWTGDVPGDSYPPVPLQITMDGNKNITANFAGTGPFILSVTAAGTGTVTINPKKDSYTKDEKVGLTATPASGGRFINWTGDVPGGSSTSNPLSITMDGNKTITANFSLLYTLSVTAAGQGTVTINPEKDSYTKDEKVGLTATPASGSRFGNWTGDVPGGSSTSNPLSITMDGNKTVTANFAGTGPFILSIAAAGQGTVTINPKKIFYIKDEKVGLTATPASGSTFRNWTGDVPEGSSTSNPLSITMDGNKTITANFSLLYTLRVTAAGQGTVTINPEKDSYTKDEKVVLTATPASGSTFRNWTGDVPGGSSTTNPLPITMDGNKTITANFEPVLFTLSVTAAGTGTVTINPKKDSYTKDEKVELQATPASGYMLKNWTGDVPGGSSTTNPLPITMDGNKKITANFAGTGPFILSVTAAGTGTVTINPKKDSYTKDEKVGLTATPASGSTFRNWTGDVPGGSSTTNPLSITMDENKTITANFAGTGPFILSVTAAGTGTVTINPKKDSYTKDERVELQAIPILNYTFMNWTGDVPGGSSTTNPLPIIMDGNKTIIANIIKTRSLIAYANPAGLGMVDKNPNKYNYKDGETVILTARYASGSRFGNWTGDVPGDSSATNPLTITMDGNKTIIANIIKTWSLTAYANPAGLGKVEKNPNKDIFNDGETVTLTATPAMSKYMFEKWSNGSTTNPLIITVNQNADISAIFTDPITVNVSIVPINYGSVTIVPKKDYYTIGEEITITATPAQGKQFKLWGGDIPILKRKANPLKIILVKTINIQAYF